MVNRLHSISKPLNSVVLCIYLSRKESQTQTLENLFGSLIRQFLEHFNSVFERENMADRVYGVETLVGRTKKEKFVTLLRSDLCIYQRVYIVVDALDECNESIRQELEIQLNALRSDRVSVMITSRYMRTPPLQTIVCDICMRENLRIYYYCRICNNGDFHLCEDCFDQHKSCKDNSHLLSEPYSALEIDMMIPDQEIQRFVELELEIKIDKPHEDYQDKRRIASSATSMLARSCERDPQLKNLVISTVVKNANGIYLFAKLYMDSLKRQATVKQIVQLLQTPVSPLADYFENTMHRINAQKAQFSDLANEILPWIIYACRPLTFEELRQATAAMREHNGVGPDELLDIKSLLYVTAGLVSIDSIGVVRLAHLIAQEYFIVHAQKWFPRAEMDIARAIMNYISSEAISKPCLGNRDGPEFEARKRSHPFLLYAATYWGDHVRNVIHEPVIQAIVLRFLRNPSNLASCVQAACWANPTKPAEWGPEGVPSSLHECERFGLMPLIPELLKDGLHVDSQEPAKTGPSPKSQAFGKQSQARVVTLAEGNIESGVKGILRSPSEKFPEDPAPVREGVAPLTGADKKGIPPGARWTKIDRKLVNPEVLEMENERYEERVDCVIVMRVLTKEEIQEYALKTQEIRAQKLLSSPPL